MIIQVTQAHIDNGIRENCAKCPITLALQEQTAWGSLARVGEDCAYLSDGPAITQECDLPEIAQEFVRDFDIGNPVKPFSFELDVPPKANLIQCQAPSEQGSIAASITHNERQGDWIQTFTGQRFYPQDPRPGEVKIEDIAHALGLICRYGGHCKGFYSVAQHSVHVCDLIKRAGLPTFMQKLGLLHDASEAYLGDMVRPLKVHMPEFQEVEDQVQLCIWMKFGLIPSADDLKVIKQFDDVSLMTEKRDIMNPCEFAWQIDAQPDKERLTHSLSPIVGSMNFVIRALNLGLIE